MTSATPAGTPPHISAAQLPAGRTGEPPEYVEYEGRLAGTPSRNLDPPIYATESRRGSLTAVDPVRFRQVLGRFCTGVTVVTAVDDGRPVGFACQAFSALSLDPPMVLFCPARTSATWRAVQHAGRFCVNVLGEHQQELSQRFGSRGADKFAGVHWSPSPSGAPLLDGALAWVEAEVTTVHDGGDHHVVLGRVTDLGCADGSDPPLLFYRGGYTAAQDATPAPAFDALLGWLGEDAWI